MQTFRAIRSRSYEPICEIEGLDFNTISETNVTSLISLLKDITNGEFVDEKGDLIEPTFWQGHIDIRSKNYVVSWSFGIVYVSKLISDILTFTEEGSDIDIDGCFGLRRTPKQEQSC